MDAQQLARFIREIPDFPKPGILFRDITPLLADAEALGAAARALSAPWRESGVDLVIGIESRGFIFGPLVAQALHAGFVPVRKPGKLPAEVLRESYDLEYGQDTVEMHADALRRGHAALIVDDLIATGGTALAACQLAERAGAHVKGFSFLVELKGLGGRRRLGDRSVHAVLEY